MVRVDGFPRPNEPTCFNKIKMGFMIGCLGKQGLKLSVIHIFE